MRHAGRAHEVVDAERLDPVLAQCARSDAHEFLVALGLCRLGMTHLINPLDDLDDRYNPDFWMMVNI
jgi:hypothetical protein